MQSDTLVIHPADPSTDFLHVIYDGRGFDVLRRYRGDVNKLLPRYKRIIMLGHGWTDGLFSIGRFPGTFAVSDDSAPALRGKDNVYIWCNAQTYVRYHGLSGYSTGMFISEVAEARLFDIKTTQRAVTYSNDLFADVMRKHIMNPTLEQILKDYDGNSSVIQFNRQQMQGIGILTREDTKMKEPKNVQAVIDWYKQVRPDMVPQIEQIFEGRDRNLEAMQALLLQGFEAGREFEKKHPTIESGIGYLND